MHIPNTTSTLIATRVVKPRAPYPLIWSPSHTGTYLIVAELGAVS